MSTTEHGIAVIDFRDPGPFPALWESLGLPDLPGSEAADVGEINWATSGPGIDWPAGYALERPGDPAHWVLWVYSPDDTLDLGRAWHPGAWVRRASRSPSGR